MLFCHLSYEFSACSVLLLLFSFSVIFTTFYMSLYRLELQLWQPTFLLNHSYLIAQPLLSCLKKLMQPLSISSHTWLTLNVACHCTNIILCQPLVLDSSLMTTRPARPNHGTPAWQETFLKHSSLYSHCY